MSDVKITVLRNGPLLVEGAIELKDHDGTMIPVTKQPAALCRCGASVNKPFCDGAHSKIGFDAAKKIVPDSAE
jgi:3-phenylpropionate/trans-cinnamate dioxygenase ferredoxin subunit